VRTPKGAANLTAVAQGLAGRPNPRSLWPVKYFGDGEREPKKSPVGTPPGELSADGAGRPLAAGKVTAGPEQ
jgi:hypothetical protein